MIIVSNPHFTAAALWAKIGGVWSCTKTAPVLRWMRRMSPDKAKIALLKMDAAWSWHQPDSDLSSLFPDPEPVNRPKANSAMVLGHS